MASCTLWKCAFAAQKAPKKTGIDPNTSYSILLDSIPKIGKKRLPIVRLAVFPLAPLVGLEPTTCGLTDHKTSPQKAKQAIKKRLCRPIFGDHSATTDQKTIFVKIAKPLADVPYYPNFPGRFLPTGIPTGKFSLPNCQNKEQQSRDSQLKFPTSRQFLLLPNINTKSH